MYVVRDVVLKLIISLSQKKKNSYLNLKSLYHVFSSYYTDPASKPTWKAQNLFPFPSLHSENCKIRVSQFQFSVIPKISSSIWLEFQPLCNNEASETTRQGKQGEKQWLIFDQNEQQHEHEEEEEVRWGWPFARGIR